MELWWGSLGTSLRVFYGIAIAASALLVLQLVALLFGADADHDFDADHDTGLGLVSIRSVTAFFTGFGWGGVVAIKEGFGLAASIAIALVTGGVLMGAVVAMLRGFAALRYSGTLDYANAVGNVGNVYVAVPGAMGGPGQVEVTVQGRTTMIQAFTRAPERLPPRARVRVVEVLDPQTVVVEPLVPAAAPAAAEPPAAAPAAPASSPSSHPHASSAPPAGGARQEA